jgi:peptide deformylase
MGIRPIVRLGDPVLAQPSQPVAELDDSLRALVDDLIQTMYAAPGVGLAAVQVGVPIRVAVIDVSLGRNPDDLMVMVNPEIVETEGSQTSEEGCLSVPGFMEPVRRASKVEVKALNLQGEEYRRTGEGLLARAIQHELDHMEGRLFLNHLGGLKRRMILRRIDKKRKAGDWA